MSRILPIVAALALLIAGGAYMTLSNGGDSLVSPAVADTASSDAAEVDGDMTLAPDMALGDPDAPITLIEYASFTCPHCGDFHSNVVERLKADYVDTGKVRFIHREVYFDRYGLWAGLIARCGGEMRYWGITDVLYATQKEWIGAGEGDEILGNLRKIGRTAGMSDEQLDACMTDEAQVQSMVAAYQKYAGEDEITGTPTMVINGVKHSNMSYDSLKEILDGLLEG